MSVLQELTLLQSKKFNDAQRTESLSQGSNTGPQMHGAFFPIVE